MQFKQTKRHKVGEKIEQRKHETTDSKVSIQTMVRQLDALFLGVKSDCHHQLEPTQRHAADYLRIKAAIDLIAQELLEAREVVTIAELEIQA